MIIGGTDTETTGLFEPDHRIIEVCLQTYEWTGRLDDEPMLLDTYTQRINPGRSIDPKARAVHGITEADLVGKPSWDIVGPEYRNRLDACDYVVAHNGFDFDFPFILQELKRLGIADPDFIPFDTMQSGRWATPFGKSPSLAELCFSCGIDYDPSQAHAAEYDVRVMMQSFFFGLRRGVFSLSTS